MGPGIARSVWLAASLVLLACSTASPTARRSPSSPPSAAASTAATSPSAAGQPQRPEPPLPEARQEVASAAADELGLFVIGGFDRGGASTPNVFRFDGSSWTREASLPVGLDHPSAATLNGRIYVAGGFTSGRAGTRVFELPGNRELSPLNHARGALALVAAGGRLFAIGGNDGTVQVGPAEEFDPAAGRWTDLPPLPRPRNHLAGFVRDGQACVAGGRSPNTNAVSCWDPRGRRWTELAPLPQPTSGAGAGTLGELAVVAGGEDPQETRMVDQLARLAGDTWRAEAMLNPRHGIQLAPYRGRLWACGGATQAGLHAVADCTSIG